MIAKEARTGVPHDDGIHFGDHVIGLIDILGERSRLAAWDFFPTTEPRKQEFLSAAQDSFGVILQWRKRLREWASSWHTIGKIPPEYAESLPDRGEGFSASQAFELGFMQFSDTMVSFTPVVNTAGAAPLGGVCSIIYTHAMAMLLGLNIGTPLRGALHVGMVGIFPEGDIYGPALACAHEMESKVAAYPRIVVSKELVDYIGEHAENTQDSPQARANRLTAAHCLAMITMDTDGLWIIHYLSKDETLGLRASPAIQTMQQQARQFVRSELNRFRDVGDAKLHGRYQRLMTYFGEDAKSAE